jgi:hypothetical protein
MTLEVVTRMPSGRWMQRWMHVCERGAKRRRRPTLGGCNARRKARCSLSLPLPHPHSAADQAATAVMACPGGGSGGGQLNPNWGRRAIGRHSNQPGDTITQWRAGPKRRLTEPARRACLPLAGLQAARRAASETSMCAPMPTHHAASILL